MVRELLQRVQLENLLGDLWKPRSIAGRPQPRYRIGPDRTEADDRDAIPFQPGAR